VYPAQAGVYGVQGIASSTNFPGSRYGHVSFFDRLTQTFCIFGGRGYDSSGTQGFLNDFWRYYTLNSTWEWVGGSNTIDSLGAAGLPGSSSRDFIPSAREFPASWYDEAKREFWLFGGYGKVTGIGGGTKTLIFRFVGSTFSSTSDFFVQVLR
jgi:hypothetical protein